MNEWENPVWLRKLLYIYSFNSEKRLSDRNSFSKEDKNGKIKMLSDINN